MLQATRALSIIAAALKIAIDGFGRHAEPRQQALAVGHRWSPSSGSIAVLSALAKRRR